MKVNSSLLLTLALAAFGLIMPTTSQALMTSTNSPAHVSEPNLKKAFRFANGKSSRKFPYFNNIATLNNSTAIYLGHGTFLTAAHVKLGRVTLFDGSIYEPVANTARILLNEHGTQADMLLFQVHHRRGDTLSRLPAIKLSQWLPTAGQPLVLIGAGSGNSYASPAQPSSFEWSLNYQVRWGINSVEETYAEPFQTGDYFTSGYATRFTAGQNDSQGTPGDSGGAAFTVNPNTGEWELCGVILGILSQNQRAAYGDTTFIGDLSALHNAMPNGARLASTPPRGIFTKGKALSFLPTRGGNR